MKYCYDEDIRKYYVLQMEIVITSIIYGSKYLTDIQHQSDKHTEGKTHTNIHTHRLLIPHLLQETMHYDDNTLMQANFCNCSTSKMKEKQKQKNTLILFAHLK